MKLYLSSYKLGDNPSSFFNLFSNGNRIGYISNALDFTYANHEKVEEHRIMDRSLLRDGGLDVVDINLKDFFYNHEDLYRLINSLNGLWVSGGNVFVLRQAMKISGLDSIIDIFSKRAEFIYGGYSAGCCVLGPTLSCYQIIDKINDFPYGENSEVVLDGLNIIDYNIIPHYSTNTPSIQKIRDEVHFCIENTLPYKTISDGEVLII